MPLHTDYRPTKLNSLVGNKATIASIESILGREKDFPHTWLFSGHHGCGKTTLARIIAGRLGIKDNDLIEINVAKFRGIESARDIIEQMRFKPLTHGGKARGWILDEVHMATKEFLNAMLKPFEDTPPHVYFFLCTTDPQKLPKTVTSRCTTYKVETLTERQLEEVLRGVLKNERVSIPDDVIKQICQDAGGSARDALVTLDTIIDMAPEQMLEAAKRVIAIQNESIELCRALMQKSNWRNVLVILQGLAEAEPETVRQAVLGYCTAILLKEDNPKAYLVMDAFINPFYEAGRARLVKACYESVMTDQP